jgi:hypothetical protein
MTETWTKLDRLRASSVRDRRTERWKKEGAEMHTHKPDFRLGIAVAAVVAAIAAPVGQAAGPDDRAIYRGTSPALAPTSQSPDDRNFYRGQAAPAALGSDDRAFARNMGEIDPGIAPVQRIVRQGGFDWGDGMIGALFALGLAMVGAASVLIAQRRRSTPSPA